MSDKEEGVCQNCWNSEGDKVECAKHCLRLENYQYNRPYLHIIPQNPKEVKLEQKEEVTIPAPINDVKKCLICGREESDKVKIRRGLCVSPCYQNWRKGELTHPVEGSFKKMGQKELSVVRHGEYKKCLIDGCEKTGNRRGLCESPHYKAWSKGRILHPEIGEFFPKRKTKNQKIAVKRIEARKETKMDFNDIVEHRIEQIRTVLTQKAMEYATDQDRWHNFNRAGEILGISPERALVGMMAKHFVSVLDLVTWAETCPEKLNDAIIDEKIGNNCNYLLLLEGLLKKRINKK